MYNNLIKEYINKVTKDMGSNQRKEVSKELETHILDSAEALAVEKNVDIDEAIIHEVITRMGSPEEVAAMYSPEKTFSDKVVDQLKEIWRITVHFIIIVTIVWIVLFIAFWIYFGRTDYIEFNMFTLLIMIIIYLVIIAFHMVKKLKIFSQH
ncbi:MULTISPECIES: HAAS signaling domain-containing protein [Methanobacterium]|jgi:hypothetical protein|uniref:DUF1700 domain-containing protein n=1 Tax=Methanobacterium bryantii TaxID=2161 RepID=A0A2A2H4M2_METBR|nr:MULTISPECIES: hypothetical protein [Methanobacterium]OEC87222.1 hypothetical protein A9507_07865 [Methanobacterium sp. A39]PAV04244.1 hypothetical protein ASJ80_05165 [Methanobacterium bryantii]